jgi:plastocyanin
MQMKLKISLIGLVILVLVFGVYYFVGSGLSISGQTVAPTVLSSQIHYIGISDFEFTPTEIYVRAGDIVVWTNYDEVEHTVTSVDGGSLDSGLIESGALYFNRFESDGEFIYRCDVHPTMKGKVIVENQ